MKDELYRNTELSAYFLWEYTGHYNALDLWYCAEEISFYFEKNINADGAAIKSIIALPKESYDYINFTRNVAYRIYIFTRCGDDLRNWFAAEKLLQNGEWLDGAIKVSALYSDIRGNDFEIKDFIRNDVIKKRFYE